MIKTNKGANPDILSCLANLSSDEVFTSPELVNKMLDMLPQDLFKSPDTKFLDPACKSGVFLREITKRLIYGLEDVFPDLQERIDHILHDQVYGIAITELTSYISRRSLYCSKFPNGEFSISKFDNSEGNIRYRRISHSWAKSRCIFCGASKDQYDRSDELESHAYEFIHNDRPEEIFNMKFDVVISNPPYQLSTGGSKSQAVPLYDKFFLKAKKLDPRYIVMIIPDRWFSGGFGLKSFRELMLSENHIKKMYDFTLASDCFPGVDIPGGICYFLWDKNYLGNCDVTINVEGKETTNSRPLLEHGCDVFIKYNEAVGIIKKVLNQGETTFDSIVSPQRPFGIPTNYSEITKSKTFSDDVCIVGRNQEDGFLPLNKISSGQDLIPSYKVFVSAAYGERISSNYFVIGKPFVGRPNTVCSETYIAVGPVENEKIALNIITYMKTKFFRFLVLCKKATQHVLQNVYSFVPMQDFTKSWSDEELYDKYKLSSEDVAFIEKMIRPMD